MRRISGTAFLFTQIPSPARTLCQIDLIQRGLVDRFRLLVYPVVLGKGKRLFREGTTANLKLLDSQSFSSGVVALIYEPNRQ
jgi:dihydrofolate reductase